MGRAGDEVRYRAFPERPDGEEDHPSRDANAITQPWPIAGEIDSERRRRGVIYSRVIAGIGIGLILYAAWRLLSAP